MARKRRIPVPVETDAEVLNASDNTCCVCHEPRRSVQVHHIDEDPENNDIANLAVLCLDCHDKTQVRGGFRKKPNAVVVRRYRDAWLQAVATKRAGISSQPAPVQASLPEPQMTHEQARVALGKWFDLEKQRQEHELRRDRAIRDYEFNLQRYKEQYDACAALIAAVHDFQVMATARYQAREAMRKPQSPETRGAAIAEAQIAYDAQEHAGQKSSHALPLLAADEDATEVVRRYRSLPAGPLFDNPMDRDARRAWKEGADELRQTIFAYLRPLKDKLASANTGE